jgi:hypothetical protein
MIVTQVEYSVVGRSRGQVALCAVHTVHGEMRSASFLVEPQNQGRRASWLILKTKGGGFLWFCLKTGGDVFLRFGVKTGGDGFLRFGLKTGGDGFF